VIESGLHNRSTPQKEEEEEEVKNNRQKVMNI
jgi:hypothetical protein